MWNTCIKLRIRHESNMGRIIIPTVMVGVTLLRKHAAQAEGKCDGPIMRGDPD